MSSKPISDRAIAQAFDESKNEWFKTQVDLIRWVIDRANGIDAATPELDATAAPVVDEARRLFELNSAGWSSVTPWGELSDDTREHWMDFARRRLSAEPVVVGEDARDELKALRVQEWMHREFNELASVQDIQQAMRTPCSCPITEAALAGD